jgi:SAM-dependent methyltransferase
MANTDPLIKFIPASARCILDIGSGCQRGAALKARGAETVLWTDAPATAPGVSVQYDRVFPLDPHRLEVPLPESHFDCAVCDELLARLPNPKPFLQTLTRLMAPGALLVLTVPNIQYYQTVVMLAEGRWDCFEGGLIPPRQLRFFTAFEIAKLLGENGFHVLRCGGLEIDPPEAFPRDENGYCTVGRVRIGPLTEDEYKAYRSRHFILFAQRPSE